MAMDLELHLRELPFSWRRSGRNENVDACCIPYGRTYYERKGRSTVPDEEFSALLLRL